MDNPKQLERIGPSDFDCDSRDKSPDRRERIRLAAIRVLVLMAAATLLTFWSPLKSLFQKADVYFAGITTVETAEQYHQRQAIGRSNEPLDQDQAESKTFYLRFNRSGLSEDRISVSVERGTGTLTGWKLHDGLGSNTCSLPDMIFSSQVRGDRTRCRIVLTVVSRGPDGHPTGIEFSELEWLSGFESMVAGAVENGILSACLFPYAVLFGKLTGFSAIGTLAILIILQFVVYGVVVRLSRAKQLETATLKLIEKLVLFSHCIAAAFCECLSVLVDF